MTPNLTEIQEKQMAERTLQSQTGSDALRGTWGWYSDASGAFIIETPEAWDPCLVSLIFPRITSSPRIDRCDIGEFAAPSRHISTRPISGQVRELQAALSITKSELARILRVSRPTVYDWMNDGQPGPKNVSRIRRLLSILAESRISASNSLFPQFVRSPVEPGGQVLLSLLCEETIAEVTIKNVIRKVKALGDAVDAGRQEREARLRTAGFEELDVEQRKAILARNVARSPWPRE